MLAASSRWPHLRSSLKPFHRSSTKSHTMRNIALIQRSPAFSLEPAGRARLQIDRHFASDRLARNRRQFAKFAENATLSDTFRHCQKQPEEQTNPWCTGLCGDGVRSGGRCRMFLGLDPMAEFEEQLRRDPQSFSPLPRERAVLEGEGLAKSAEIVSFRLISSHAHKPPYNQTKSWRTGLYGDGTRHRQQAGRFFGP
jgi:hypothetical protein